MNQEPVYQPLDLLGTTSPSSPESNVRRIVKNRIDLGP